MKTLNLIAVAALGLSTLAMAGTAQDQFESNNNWHMQNHVVSGDSSLATVKTAAATTQLSTSVAAGGQDLFESNNNWHQQNHVR